MRQLTEAQRAAMEAAYNEWYDADEGRAEWGAFLRGFTAGLDHAQANDADLLAALRGLVEFCDRQYPTPSHRREPMAIKQARAALARVEGGE